MASQTKRIGNQPQGGAEIVAPGGGLLAERPTFLRNTGNAGRENVTQEDLILPRLEIVQALSDQWQPDKPGYIPGAKVGDLYNNVTKQLYPQPLEFMVVKFEKQFNLWKLRKFGGGFMGSYPTSADAQRELDTRVESSERDKHEVLDTPVFYSLIVLRNDDQTIADIQPIAISMPRTKAKHARRLNTMIDMTKEDVFNRVYAVNAVNDKNQMGQEFRNYSISQLPGYPDETMYNAAVAFYKRIQAGQTQINRAGENAPDAGGSPEF
jgi:hypothetical protein